MLRYVRIGNDRRTNFLGAEAEPRESDQQSNEMDVQIGGELDRFFTMEVDTWSVPFLWTGLCGFARFTALIHLSLALLVGIAISVDTANDIDRLKSMTTKTVTAWVATTAPEQTPIRDFGPNPREWSSNITISDSCVIAGDSASRSSKFNTRQIIFEVGEVDCRIMILFFFLLSFAFQGAGAYCRDRYYEPLKRGDARRSHLIEYSVSASLMMVIMCLQLQVGDAYTLANVFSNTWACMIFGLLSDVLSEFAADESLVWNITSAYTLTLQYAWLAHMAGWFTLIIAAAAMMSSIGAFYECLDGISLPNEVFVVIVIEAVLFFCFGAVQLYTLWFKEHKGKKPRTLDGMPYYAQLVRECRGLHIGTNGDITNHIATAVALETEVSTRFQLKHQGSDFFLGLRLSHIFSRHIEDMQKILLCRQNLDAQEATREKNFKEVRSIFIDIQKRRILVAYRAEYAYIALSLLAKSLLGGILYISAIVRT
jgi:hypothetical protein